MQKAAMPPGFESAKAATVCLNIILAFQVQDAFVGVYLGRQYLKSDDGCSKASIFAI
jgi:hypothetical protein